MLKLLLLSLLAVAPTAFKDETLYSEDYQFVTEDGAWCWFSDPRAIYVDDTVFGGFVDMEGSIWAFTYDPATQARTQTKVFDKLQYDDHCAPSVMSLPDKRIMIFFSAHGPSPLYYTTTKRPMDISEWEEVTALDPMTEGGRGYCYSNPVTLSDEGGRTYLFFRGKNFKPCMVSTADFKTWSDAVTVVDKMPGPHQGERPYMKVASNGRDRIFLAFTDGHPRGEPTNSIYFLMYKDGAFRKADGTVVTEGLNSTYPEQADVVYDAKKTFDKAWIWDVAVDKNDRPVLVYARFSDSNNEHSYWYAFWNGSAWENHKITNCGEWFMRKNYNDKNIIEKENNYSGGVYLDHNDTRIVYTSRPINNVFEIEKWVFDGGKWTSESVTRDSERDNVRPFVIRDYPAGKPNLMWMYNYDYPYFREFVSAIRINQKAAGFDASLDREAIRTVSDKVFAWQMKQPAMDSETARGWKAGAMYIGMFDWSSVSGDKAQAKFLTDIFNHEKWQVGNRMYHADDFCVAQTYLDFYMKEGKDNMLIPTKARVDWILDNEPAPNIDNTKGASDRWWWCDALYMAPGVYSRLWSITGKEKYMKFAHKEFQATRAQLFDSGEHLFYRDSKYFNRREANGAKVFWSRGNGWVLGGLKEVLSSLPAKDKKYRPYYEALFKEMCDRILELQNADGSWHSSLLDQETYAEPEMSGTGLFVAAFAYGVNEGLLPADKYLPAIEKGWRALVSSVDTEGRLCWVQPVGAAPRNLVKKSSELYGVGGFLNAAAQVYRLAK